jgi:hypothetical protein
VPILTFIVPLAAAATVSDWRLTELLCGWTLSSCLAQRHSDITVELCCHDVPAAATALSDRRLTVHQAPFPPPAKADFAQAGMHDKWRKVALGLIAAKDRGSEYVMIVDADDYVSRRLAGYLSEAHPPNGVILKTGYRYHLGSPVMQIDRRFNCGTNAIVHTGRVHLPSSLDAEDRKRSLILTAGHTTIESAMRGQETPLAPLPFPGAVYVTHGAQHSVAVHGAYTQRTLREKLGAMRRARPTAWLLRREFGVDPGAVRQALAAGHSAPA